jgi:hypothetical protein
MSDYWLSLVLEEVLNEETYSLYDVISEMRKEDKVKGKKKPPLKVMVPSKTNAKGVPISGIERNSEGKLVKVTPKHEVTNPDIILKRARQGMPIDREKAPSNYRDYLTDPKGQIRHKHGGKERNLRGHIVVPAGKSRGVRKNRQAKQAEKVSPETHPGTNITKNSSAGRIYQARADAEAKKASQASQHFLYGNRRG